MKSAMLALLASSVLLIESPVRAAPGDAPAAPQGATRSMAAIEKASQLIQTAGATADLATRTAQLTEARQLLDGFIKDHSGNEELAHADMWLGLLLTAQGKGELAVALAQTDAAQQAAQVEPARKTFREAERSFSSAVDRFYKALESFPKFIEPNTPMHQRSQALLGNLIQCKMYQAAVIEELAATYAEGNATGREFYQSAADKYDLIYRDYRTRIAGLMARLKQGQCYRNLGDTKRALGLYADLLDQPSDLEPLRRLRVSAMYLSLEAWTASQEKLYELALTQGEKFLLDQRPEEKAWPEWQAVRLHTARGYLLAADSLAADKATDRAEYLTHARGHAAALAETAGPYQAAARQVVTQAEAAGAAKAP
jgi:tetratricopeptide (TPR) repeat protein